MANITRETILEALKNFTGEITVLPEQKPIKPKNRKLGVEATRRIRTNLRTVRTPHVKGL